MSVRYGPTSVLYSGDEQRAREYLPVAMQWLRVTQERQRAGGVDIMRYTRELAEDAYCYVTLGGGMSILHIVAGAATVEQGGEIARDLVPDFVSGAVRNGYIEKEFPNLTGQQDALATFKPTGRCFWRYYREDGAENWLRPGYSHVRRLAVEPHNSMGGVMNSDPNSSVTFSQYTKLKPTMYSGTMRKCVQALMGFGRQRKNPKTGRGDVSLYDYPDIRWERIEPVSDEDAMRAQDVREAGLQIQYDWRWPRTHGLTRAADGVWWLVEISKSRGIVAMRLPLHPATTLPEFREKCEDENDLDAIRLLDEFGGFPTGETFPAELAPWIDAGKVLRLLEPDAMAAYYEHSQYSPDIGWAFNLRGSEAHNTAWRFGDDGCQRGVHYACALEIGTSREYVQAEGLAARLESLRGVDGIDSNELDAARWKCGLLSDSDRRHAAEARTAADCYQRVRAVSVSPLATGGASISKVSEGFLYGYPKVLVQRNNNMKFPALPLDYLKSHDMRPWDEDVPHPGLCDTTMFVFFAGNELKWVKFFWDGREIPFRNEDNYEQCMFIGEWERHEEAEEKRIPMMFYSNDLDHREEIAGFERHTHIKSEDLGYYLCEVVDGLGWFKHAGTVKRRKRFLRMTDTKTTTARTIRTGIGIPIGEREGYYYAKAESTERFEHTIYHDYTYQWDPYTYQHWRNRARANVDEWDSRLAWCNTHGSSTAMCMSEGDEDRATGTWERLQDHPTGCGKSLIRTVVTPGVDYWIFDNFYGWWLQPGQAYFPSDCSEADEGPWLFGCEHATPLAYEIPPAPLPPPVEIIEEGLAFYDVWLVTSSSHGPIRTVEEKPITESHDGFELWELPSPSVDPPIEMSIYETHNVLGEGDVIRYSQDMNDIPNQIKGRPEWPEMKTGELTFVGVVDG